jgi:hypothetical protein
MTLISTYAEERAEKERARARRAKKYVYAPVGLDAWSPRPGLEPGARVIKVQPGGGVPRNGTMGHCYVGDAETGAFIGLVLEASLRPEGAA